MFYFDYGVYSEMIRMMKTTHLMLFNHVAAILLPRGVTTLVGARGKKQVWRPHVRT